MLNQVMQSALHLIFPPQCMMCDTLLSTDFGVCGECWSQIDFVSGTSCYLCGVRLLGHDQNAPACCDDCLSTPRPWSGGTSVFMYGDLGRKMVLGLKHGDRTELAEICGPWLGAKIGSMECDTPVLVPVPLHRHRLLTRRYNQSALLAGHAAKYLKCEWIPDALIRHRKTPSLDGKSKEERFAILANSILANAKFDLKDRTKDRTIVLIDDVMTSGATLGACADECYKAGARDVKIATLARVAKDT